MSSRLMCADIGLAEFSGTLMGFDDYVSEYYRSAFGASRANKLGRYGPRGCNRIVS